MHDGYQWLHRHHETLNDDREWMWIWKLPVLEKVHSFTWLTIHEALPVNVNKLKCHLATSATCTRCSLDMEDGLHCLRDCPLSRASYGEGWVLGPGQTSGSWTFTGGSGSNREAGTRCVLRLGFGELGWRNNALLDPAPWLIDTSWNKLRHDHDDFSRFAPLTMEIDDGH